MKEKLIGMTRYLPGLILMFLGLIILAFPMLLVAFVAALLVMGGILAVAIAHRTKHLEDDKEYRKTHYDQTQEHENEPRQVSCHTPQFPFHNF